MVIIIIIILVWFNGYVGRIISRSLYKLSFVISSTCCLQSIKYVITCIHSMRIHLFQLMYLINCYLSMHIYIYIDCDI